MKNNVIDTIRKVRTLAHLLEQMNATLNEFESDANVSLTEALEIMVELGDKSAKVEAEALYEHLGDALKTTPVTPVTGVEDSNVVDIPIPDEEHSELISSSEDSEEDHEPRHGGKIVSEYGIIIEVTRDGTVYRYNNDELLEQKYSPSLGSYVYLGGGQRLLKNIVGKAWLFPTTVKDDIIIQKNGNNLDCRVSNLEWKSRFTGSIPKPRIDKSDVRDISIALVENDFDIDRTCETLAREYKRCSSYAVKGVMEKRMFPEISDLYFDHHLNKVNRIEVPRPSDVPVLPEDVEVTRIPTTFDRKKSITDALDASEGDMHKAYDILKDAFKDVSMFEIFNIKNGGKGTPNTDDINIVIRCARNGGGNIRETLLRECDLVVDNRQIQAACRKHH